MSSSEIEKEAILDEIVRLRESLSDLAVRVSSLKVSSGVDSPELAVRASTLFENTGDSYMTAKQVQQYLSIGSTKFYTMIASGLLPKGYSIGSRGKRWRRSEIDEFLNGVSS